MNLLIVSDKTDVKMYQSIVKTAPNVSVLGAVTKVNDKFISILHEKYNPHAILFDVDVPVVSIDEKTVVEQIKQTYPYMKVLVLTSEDDNNDYPVDCVIQGQISNIKLKEILQKFTTGFSEFNDESSSRKNEKDEEEKHLPKRITFDSNIADKLSTPKIARKGLRFSGIHFNPLIIAGIAVGIVILLVVILVIIKSGSEKGQPATPDEAVIEITAESTEAAILFTEATTAILEYPTFPTEYHTVVTESEYTISPTIAPEPTVAPTIAPPTVRHQAQTGDAQSTAANSQQSGSPLGNASSSGNSSDSNNSKSSSDNKRSSSENSNSNNSGGSSQSNQPETKVYGGEPIVSYDDNGRYSNAGGNLVSNVKLSYNAKTLRVGDTLQLTATVSPANANQSVKWSSSNSSVVSVSNGLIAAKNTGTSTITATANNGKSASCQITVQKKEQTDSVHLSASGYHINLGQTITVTLYGTNNCSWSVSNSNPIQITPDKNQVKVRTRRTGNTQIYAKDINTNKIYVCNIYVE